jgi:competence protein ComEC
MYRSLYILVGGFLTGVLWRSFFDVGILGVSALVCGTCVVALVAYLRRFHTSACIYIILFAFACALGVTRTDFATKAYIASRAYAPPGFIASDGLIAREPDVRDGYTILILRVLDASGETPLLVRAKVSPYPTFSYGDKVTFAGELEVPRAFENEIGRVFDYPGYLMKEGVQYTLAQPVVRSAGTWEGNRVYAFLLSIKHAWLRSVSQLIPEPGASLAGGLIVGAKQSLGEYWLEVFRVTGIIHIVVLSGYNLTLIADSMLSLCRRFPRRIALAFGILGIASFALMAGMSATVVRASAMAILALVATHTNRPHTAIRLLAIAGFFMVLVNPFVLVFDTGFQLSFLATLGLILYAPMLEKRFTRVPKLFGLRSIVSATFATQLAVLPLLLYQMGQVSLIAPLANVLVLPVVPIIMALVFGAGMLGMVSSAVASPFAWIGHLLLSYIFMVVEFGAGIPFASVSLPPLPLWTVLVMYGGIAFVMLRLYTNIPRKKVSRGMTSL